VSTVSGYFDRAKRIYSRGDVVSTAFVLAEGLRRDVGNSEALEWLMHIYVREVDRTGIERDLVRILHQQPNGGLLLTKIRERLEEQGSETKLEALRRVVIIEGEPRDVSAPAPNAAPDVPEEAPELRPALPTPLPLPPQGEAAEPTGENWGAFASPLEGGSPRLSGARASVATADAPAAGGPMPAGTMPSGTYEPPADEVLDADALRGEGFRRSVPLIVAALALIVVALVVILVLAPRGAEPPEADLEPVPAEAP
jgi:hypothetical protein